MTSLSLSAPQALTLLRMRLIGVPSTNALRHIGLLARAPVKGDLTGRTFGRLTVVRRAVERYRLNGDTRWWCRCRCGHVVVVRKAGLIEGDYKSCGCLHREVAAALGAKKFKHGHCRRRGLETPEYISWLNMRRKHRKITYWRWHRFANFLADMGAKPPGTKLRRLCLDAGFKPGNVVWKLRS